MKTDLRTQDQRLRDFALDVITHLRNTPFWEDEYYWDISNLGLPHTIFYERYPTQQELEDGSVEWYEGNPPLRFIQPWVLDYLTDLTKTPIAKNPMEVML
jgi:hypothetical protein